MVMGGVVPVMMRVEEEGTICEPCDVVDTPLWSRCEEAPFPGGWT